MYWDGWQLDDWNKFYTALLNLENRQQARRFYVKYRLENKYALANIAYLITFMPSSDAERLKEFFGIKQYCEWRYCAWCVYHHYSPSKWYGYDYCEKIDQLKRLKEKGKFLGIPHDGHGCPLWKRGNDC